MPSAADLLPDILSIQTTKTADTAATTIVNAAYLARNAARAVVDASIAAGGVSEITMTAQLQTLLDASTDAAAKEVTANEATAAYQQAKNTFEQDLYTMSLPAEP